MARNSFLHRSLLTLAALAACMGTYAFAQPPAHPHPHPHGGGPPGPPGIHALDKILSEASDPHTSASATAATDATPKVLDATHLGTPLLLDKNWRVGITADSSAASPAFDDSTWAVRNASESIADVSDPDSDGPPGHDSDPEPSPGPGHGHHREHPFAWFRMHIKLAPNHGPLALLIELPVSYRSYFGLEAASPDTTVFANGKEIRPTGPNNGTPERYLPITRLYNLDIDPNATDLTLAIRTLHIPFGLMAYTHFFALRTVRLGSPEELSHSVEIWNDHSLFERLPKLVNSILLTILSLFLLALYFTQKGHREYLWLALYELLQAPLSFIDLAGKSAYLEQISYEALYLQLIFVSAYLYFEFLVAFLDLRRRWASKRKRWFISLLRWTAPILLLIGPTLYYMGRSSLMFLLLILVSILAALWIIGWMLFCCTVLILATVRRNFEAGMLLVPLVLSSIGILEPALTSGMVDWTGRTYYSPLTIFAGPVPIHFASIADFAGLLAIVLIIFVRFQRIHRDRERTASELHAARSVQEVMIPLEKVKTPGFEVDSVYNPAAEVGGDFFHLETTPEGGLLVVIGDVAGKGLQAAMNVSMLVGALRRGDETRPAKILEALNRVLVGNESFTTCEAAWFGPNGELVVASAGHLPPYLNSQEIALPGGLPLGVMPNATYDEVRLYLHPGDRILFLSDGVVEARNPSGELFGFDRVHNLSNQSAFYIADAAKAFGQEDDITVLTVRRLATAVAAA